MAISYRETLEYYLAQILKIFEAWKLFLPIMFWNKNIKYQYYQIENIFTYTGVGDRLSLSESSSLVLDISKLLTLSSSDEVEAEDDPDDSTSGIVGIFGASKINST